ncbi:MAG TPA: thioesterase family protein [Accumulibacter sp.]|nr:thioesterase family protein [Accumulibacter sp.]
MPAADASIAHFPMRTCKKLRYADTGRQEHVNNAMFPTMFETGRGELLYASDSPLPAKGCVLVIASLHLDFHGENTWPGRVDIGSRVSTVGTRSLTLEQGMFQSHCCVATAKTAIVQMNEKSRRSHPLSNATRAGTCRTHPAVALRTLS